jgi:hypothetical protein
MRREDVAKLICCKMPGMTDGPFDVKIESDQASTHICIYIENHDDAKAIVKKFCQFQGEVIIVIKVPPQWLEDQR